MAVLRRSLVALVLLAGCGPAPAVTPPSAGPRPQASSPPPAPAASTSSPAQLFAVPALAPPLARTEPPVKAPAGTPDPIFVTAAGATGRWVAYCQARKDTDGDGHIGVPIGPHGDPYGDALEHYLRIGDGPEEVIDEVVTAGEDGRHLVVTQRGRLVLIDSGTGARLDLTSLGADARGNPSPLASHGAASLDAQSGRVLYHVRAPPQKKAPPAAKKPPAKKPSPWVVAELSLTGVAVPTPAPASTWLVVRDIATGKETSIDPGPGALLGAWLSGPRVMMTVRVGGAPGRVTTTFAPRKCRGPAASYSVFGSSGTELRELRTARVPLAVSAPSPAAATPARAPSPVVARTVPDWIANIGDAMLRRGASGALLLEREGAKDVEIAGADCGAHVIGIHEPTGHVLVTCKDGSLALHGEGIHAVLDAGPGYESGWNHVRISGEPLLLLYGPSGPDVVVDLERGKMRTFSFKRISYSDGIESTRGRRILLRRETGLFLTDFDAEGELALPGAIVAYPRTIVGGRVVYVEPLVVDMDAAAVLGSTGRGVEVFSALPTGHLLATPERTGMYVLNAFPPGPAAWTWPGKGG